MQQREGRVGPRRSCPGGANLSLAFPPAATPPQHDDDVVVVQRDCPKHGGSNQEPPSTTDGPYSHTCVCAGVTHYTRPPSYVRRARSYNTVRDITANIAKVTRIFVKIFRVRRVSRVQWAEASLTRGFVILLFYVSTSMMYTNTQ